MKLLIITILLFLNITTGLAQDSIVNRIYLVGDAGELKQGKNSILDWLRGNINWNDSINSIIFLGDNIYPKGLPKEASKNYPAAKAALDYQINIVRNTKAKAFFINGNHDWSKGGTNGWQQVLHTEAYLTKQQLPNVLLLPQGGCPGPAEFIVNDRLVLVCIDSQWWLHQHDKPGIESDCDTKTTAQVIAALNNIMYRHADKMVVVATHHPMYTNGMHGGYYGIKQHLFPLTDLNKNYWLPLPVLGSLYPVTRGVFGNIQDVQHPLYKTMITAIETALKKHPNAIHVAGHEHTLQLQVKDSINYIVSGSGAKSSRVKKGKYSVFAAPDRGFALLEQYSNGAAKISFYTADGDEMKLAYSKTISTSIASTATTTISEAGSFPDSIEVAASTQYVNRGKLHRFLLGNNYRKEWATPVKVKVFNIKKEGLTITQRGGGLQSKSLRLQDAAGKEYVLRSIEKFPEAAVPEDLRETIAKDVVQDQISASHPFGALAVPPLAAAANVPHSKPQVVYIPDDPQLGIYQKEFANQLFLFEEREPVAGKTISTAKMLEKLYEDNDNSVDQVAVLQARLLDMFIGDWDRHDDQWRWGVIKNKKQTVYYPIPRDRDQAFFVNEGLISKAASRPWIMPKFQGFKTYFPFIQGFNFNARYFDRSFLTALSADQWQQQVNRFLQQMNDPVLAASIAALPSPIQAISGNTILKKLQARKKIFATAMMTYYRFLSKTVCITGTNKNELFDIKENNDQSITITVAKISKSGDIEDLLYQRSFDPAVTKELRLYGLDGNDSFHVTNSLRTKIVIRVIGGSGTDIFTNENSAKKIKVYESKLEQNRFTGNWKQKLTDDASIYEYNRKEFKYNITAPQLSVAFNPDDGLYLGAGFKHTGHRFRRSPAVVHKLTVNHALATNAYNIKYDAVFFKAIGNADLLLDAHIKAPNNVINFFGYGNNTRFDKTKPGKIRYYRTRFQTADLALLLQKRLGNTVTINAGPALQYYSLDSSDNNGRFITQTTINGLDAAALYKRKFFGGVQTAVIFDNRNSVTIPTRGLRWQTSFRSLSGLNRYSNHLSQLNSDLSVYLSFNSQANLVFSTRLGGGINFGTYEFYQSQFLSGTENLRGYRKYRFAGDKMLYHNIDMRIKLADFKTYILPGSLGLVFFHDVGRVWQKNNPSGRWHTGYGGGLWVSPLKRFVITASYGVGDDGGLPMVSFGFQY